MNTQPPEMKTPLHTSNEKLEAGFEVISQFNAANGYVQAKHLFGEKKYSEARNLLIASFVIDADGHAVNSPLVRYAYGDNPHKAILNLLQKCEAMGCKILSKTETELSALDELESHFLQKLDTATEHNKGSLVTAVEKALESNNQLIIQSSYPVKHYIVRAGLYEVHAIYCHNFTKKSVSAIKQDLTIAEWLIVNSRYMSVKGDVRSLHIEFLQQKKLRYLMLKHWTNDKFAFEECEDAHQKMLDLICAGQTSAQVESIMLKLNKEFSEMIRQTAKKIVVRTVKDSSFKLEFLIFADKIHPDPSNHYTVVSSEKPVQINDTKEEEIPVKFRARLVESLIINNQDKPKEIILSAANPWLNMSTEIQRLESKYFNPKPTDKFDARDKSMALTLVEAYREFKRECPTAKVDLEFFYHQAIIFKVAGLVDEAIKVLSEGIEAELSRNPPDAISGRCEHAVILAKAYYSRAQFYLENSDAIETSHYKHSVSDIYCAMNLDREAKVVKTPSVIIKMLRIGEKVIHDFAKEEWGNVRALSEVAADQAVRDKKFETAIEIYGHGIVSADAIFLVHYLTKRGFVRRMSAVECRDDNEYARSQFLAAQDDANAATWLINANVDFANRVDGVDPFQLRITLAMAWLADARNDLNIPGSISRTLESILWDYEKFITLCERHKKRDEIVKQFYKWTCVSTEELARSSNVQRLSTAKIMLTKAIKFFSNDQYKVDSLKRRIKRIDEQLNPQNSTATEEVASTSKDHATRRRRPKTGNKVITDTIKSPAPVKPKMDDAARQRAKELELEKKKTRKEIFDQAFKKIAEDEEYARIEEQKQLDAIKLAKKLHKQNNKKTTVQTDATIKIKLKSTRRSTKVVKNTVAETTTSYSEWNFVEERKKFKSEAKESEESIVIGKKKPKIKAMSSVMKRILDNVVGEKIALTDFEIKIAQVIKGAVGGSQAHDRVLETDLKLPLADLMRAKADTDFQCGYEPNEIIRLMQECFGDSIVKIQLAKHNKQLVRLIMRDGDDKELKRVDIRFNPLLVGPNPDYYQACHESEVTMKGPLITPDGVLHCTEQGLADLKAGILRMSKLPRTSFEENPIRILRLFHHLATLQQVNIAEKTSINYVLADNQVNPDENIPPAIAECLYLLNEKDQDPGEVNYWLKNIFFHANHKISIQCLHEFQVVTELLPDFAHLFDDVEFLIRFFGFIAKVKDKNTSSSIVYDYFLNEVKSDNKETITHANRFLNQHYLHVEERLASEPLSILREIERAARFDLPLQERVLVVMRQHAHLLRLTPAKSNQWLQRIISTEHYMRGIHYLIVTGVFDQLFPELIPLLKKNIHDIYAVLCSIVQALTVTVKEDKQSRSLTNFYDELLASVPIEYETELFAAKNSNPMLSNQYEYLKGKFAKDLDDMLAKQYSPEEINTWLSYYLQPGKAEWAFNVMLEKGMLAKLFPTVHP
ncbi:MAG: hypothetical protein ABI370_06440, partial [Gammaproteobacteria bacterium]